MALLSRSLPSANTSFLTDITALQVEMLAALMATKHCDTVELF
jgi:hypothetical protein